MSSGHDSLGDRMKAYEAATAFVLPRRTYTIIRADGRAFHTLLRGAEKPFDSRVVSVMDQAAKDLCRGIEHACMAYVQSDEVSVVLQDFKTHATEPWFGGVVQKQASIAASIATASFNYFGDFVGLAHFDARTYTIPSKTEVMNYLLWRQQDAARNSVSMLARSVFSHRELQGKSVLQMLDMLSPDHAWEELPDRYKRGGVCVKEALNWPAHPSAPTNAKPRTQWVVSGAPIFEARPGSFLDNLIPTLE